MTANLPTSIRAVTMWLLFTTLAQPCIAQKMYTAPLGPFGTWKVYEYVDTATTFWEAHQAATESVYSGVSGHLVTIHSKEEDLAVGRMAGGDIWVGLTDQAQLGGTEAGPNASLAKWAGWRGAAFEIPPELSELVQSDGWVWGNGEPYDYQAWDVGEPNNFGTGEGGVRRRSSGFWSDDGMGAFGQVASVAPYVIEYETHSPSPVPGTLQLDPIFPAARLPGIEGDLGFVGVQVYQSGRSFDDVEPVISSLALGELNSPSIGTASVINLHDPQSGGGGLFPSGRLIFPGNTAADDNNFQVLIKGAIEVPPGQGGDWTFNVHADDGFAFRIDGAEFTSAHGNGYIDFVDRRTLTYPKPTGDANTRGVINLAPGVYPFEFVMFELGGGAFCELSAAPGRHPSEVSTTQWTVVNSANSPLKFVPFPTKPVITQQPVNLQVAQGSPATLSVSVSGTAPLSYQWRHNGVEIPGATAASLTINSTQPANVGDYTVVVSNSAGSVTSQVARLALAQAPMEYAAYLIPTPVSFIMTTEPQRTIDRSGRILTSQQYQTVRFADDTFLAQGVYHLFKIPNTGQMTIRWKGFATGNHQVYFSYWNGTQFVIRDIRNATGNQSYEITVNRPSTETSVFILINCTDGQINTDELAVIGPPSQSPALTTQPQSITAPRGGTATFSVVATGSAPLSYQWKLNGADIPGATNSSYTITSVQQAQAGNYSVTVTNSAGSATSVDATLSVDPSSVLALSDPTFNDSEWDLIVFPSTSQSGATASKASDGNGNQDPYLKITHTLGGEPPSVVRSVHIRTLPYSPTTQGAIASLTYSEEARVIETEANTIGGSTGPALRQNGKLYVIELGLTSSIRDSTVTPLPSPYKPIQLKTLTSGNFVRLIGATRFNVAEQPDFSANGSPIEFGFFRVNSHTASAQTTRISAIDNFKIILTRPPDQPPTITTQPQNLTVTAGGSATLSVTAAGTEPLRYQWRFGGKILPNETNATLSIENAQPAQAGNYDVVVANNAGSITSQVAILTVEELSADVAVFKTASANQVVQYKPFTYTIIVTNKGPAAAQGVELVDVVPEGMKISSASRPECSLPDLATCECFFPTIAAGQGITIQLEVAGFVAGNFTNSVVVTSKSSDPDPSNNRGEVPIEITHPLESGFSQPEIAGGEFKLSFSGGFGRSYVLECSADLIEWLPIAWFTYIDSPFLFSEPISLKTASRLYRVREIALPSQNPCSENTCRPVVTGDAVQETAWNDMRSPSSCAYPCTVLLHSGEEHFERTDLAIPGRGDIHFVMRRDYRSKLAYNGPIGFGWNFNYNERLFIESNGDATRVNGGSHIDRWVRQPNGTFRAPSGHFRTLTRQANGLYLLREANGLKRVYAVDGRLLMHEDRFGNRMLFGYDADGSLRQVTDPYGRVVQFFFQTFPDGIARLVRVRDFTGREVLYSYDDRGDLVGVRTPVITGTSTGNDFPNGRTERYTYSSSFANPDLNHNLLSVTLPEENAAGGPPAILWTYGTDPADPATFDRVTSHTLGGTNASGIPAGGTATFDYAMLNTGVPLGDPSVLRGRARITTPNGNRMEFFVNELNHHVLTRQLTRGLRPDEVAAYETRSFFNSDGLLERRIFPEGNELRYVYASAAGRPQRQNVLEIRRIAGPRGGGEDLVTTFTYEPLFNQIASVTDPRGTSANYVPPVGTHSATRYTTRFFYDYQESTVPVPEAQATGTDLSGVARGLGDLNGDSRTDQLFGNLVRILAPTVQLLPDSNEAILSGGTLQTILTEILWNDHGQRTSVIDPEGNVQQFTYYPDKDPDGDGHIVPTLLPHLGESSSGYLRSSIADAGSAARRRTQTPPASLETLYRYDAVGNIVAVRNPRGVVTEYEVNQLNETIQTTHGADVSVALQTGQLLEVEAPKRYISRNFRDANGRVVRSETENRDSHTEGVGDFVEETFSYDLLNSLVRRTAEVDAKTTLTWHYRYDPEQLPIQTIKPEGNTDTVEYDERNLPFRVTRGFGSAEASTTQVDYDLNGNRKRITDAEDTDGNGQREAVLFSYDGFDRLVRATDALGNESQTTYDVAGNAVRVQAWGHPPNNPGAPNVLLAHRSFLHDELGRVFQTDVPLFVSQGFTPVRPPLLLDHDNNGFVTTRMDYDALSRVTSVVEDDLQTSRRIYDGVGRVIETIDQVGNRHRTTYDRNSNAIRSESIEVSPEGLVPNEVFTTHYVYDQLDRLVRATDNAGQTTRFSYDSRNLLVHRSDPEGPLTSDPLNLFPGQINGGGNTYSFFHDGLGRRIRQISDLRIGGTGAGALDTSNPHNPDGQIMLGYVFDGNSRAVGIVDDKGNRTSFGYDALDRKISHTFADGKRYAYVYDRDDNLRTITDPNGSVATRVFDVLNRLLETTIQRGPGVIGTTRETFAYDGLSRLVRATDDNGNTDVSQHVVENDYDSLGRLLEERQDGKAISSRYTGDGKRTQITYPGGRVISRTFDPIDRIKQIQDGNTVLAATDWIGPGMRELRRINGNGTQLTFLNDAGSQDVGYDAVKRLVKLRVLSAGGVPIVDRDYAYNRASQRTAERRHDDFGLTDRYTYDSSYRVVASSYDQDGLPDATTRDLSAIAYGYDGVGNRREVTGRKAIGPFAENYTVNEVNEYTSVAGIAQLNDDSGNLTDDGTRLFSYDYRNRLISVRSKATGHPIATYEYLPDGRRAKKIVYSQTEPGVVARAVNFLWDGQQEVEEQNAASGATDATFVWSPVYIDELVQFQNSLGSFYTHQDARCNVVGVTDAAGTVVERITYDDFGNAEIRGPLGEARSESAVGNDQGFQGRRKDPETGLYYFRARYYEPHTGRFIQRDPVWDSVNVGGQYTFAGNQPTARRDPSGLQADNLDEAEPMDDFMLERAESVARSHRDWAASQTWPGFKPNLRQQWYTLISAWGYYGHLARTAPSVLRSTYKSAQTGLWDAVVAIAIDLNEQDRLSRGEQLYDWDTYVQRYAYQDMLARRKFDQILTALAATGNAALAACGAAGARPQTFQNMIQTGPAPMLPGTVLLNGPCPGSGGAGSPPVTGSPGVPPTNSPITPISVEQALDRAQAFMQPGVPIRVVYGPSGVQFIQTFPDGSGHTVTKRVGFDLDPNTGHVKKLGPHLNLQTQIDGVIQGGSLADPHIPINPTTIRKGDY